MDRTTAALEGAGLELRRTRRFGEGAARRRMEEIAARGPTYAQAQKDG